MTIDVPDLTTLSLASFMGLLLLVAGVDTAAGVVVALIRNTFSADKVLEYLRSHVLLRVFPIFALALIGHGIPQLAVPAIAPAWAAAVLSFTAYIVETIGSLRSTFATPTP